MPSKNLEKIYLPDTFYHIYNRGINKRVIFRDSADFAVYLNLLKRYLDTKPSKDKKGREYPWLHDSLELLAFCLMPNHFHLLIYQNDAEAMTQLLRGVATSYTGYFNKKYGRIGPLFQDRFKAAMVTRDSYLQHISRYVHLNPKNYRSWEFSSLPYYLGTKQAGWVQPKRIMELFEGSDYSAFLKDYEGHKKMLEEIKHEMAD